MTGAVDPTYCADPIRESSPVLSAASDEGLWFSVVRYHHRCSGFVCDTVSSLFSFVRPIWSLWLHACKMAVIGDGAAPCSVRAEEVPTDLRTLFLQVMLFLLDHLLTTKRVRMSLVCGGPVCAVLSSSHCWRCAVCMCVVIRVGQGCSGVLLL